MDANHSQSPGQRPDQIPIAQLSPTFDNLSRSSIHATVSLLWPYSSSTKSLGLLLAEPDFRLRRSNGQVKVIFHGHIAESVATSKLGIGDDVLLSLEGARFVDNQATTQTPGKCVKWDLHFEDRVLIEVFRASERLSTIKVDPPSSPVPNIRVTSPTPVTPAPKFGPLPDGITPVTHTESWQSPAFVGRSRTSFGVLVDSAFDPFAEEDGYVPGKGRKRARFSMRNNDWRIIDEPEVPGEDDMPLDWTHIFDEAEVSSDGDKDENADTALPAPTDTTEVAHTEIDVPTTRSSPGPSQSPAHTNPKELSRQPEKQPFPDLSAHIPINTPRLNPIPSPGLPIPSPLVTTPSSQGYFGSVEITSHAQFEPVASKLSQEFLETTNEIPQPVSAESENRLEVKDTVAESLKISTAPQAVQISESTKVTERIERNFEDSAMKEQGEKNIESVVVEAANTEMPEEGDVHEDDVSDEPGRSEMEGDESQESESDEADSEDETRDQERIGSKPTARDRGSANMPESIVSDSDAESEENSEISGSLKEDFGDSESRIAELGDRTVSDQGDEYSSRDEADEDRDAYEYEEDEDEDDDQDDIGEEDYYRVGSGDEEAQSIDDEYDERAESEIESDHMSIDDVQPSQAPKAGPPEVIVLDSDSEDEAPPYYRTSHSEQSHADSIVYGRRSTAASEEEESVFYESEPATDMDHSSEADEPQEDDDIEPERDERRLHTESIEGRDIEHRTSDSEAVGDRWPEDGHMEGRLAGNEVVDDQMGDSYAEQQPSREANEPPVTLAEQDDEDHVAEEPQHFQDDSAGVNAARSASLPLQHDELQYASPAQPANHGDMDTPPVTSSLPLAIDPELYSSAPVQEVFDEEADQMHPGHEDEGRVNEETSLHDPEQDTASAMTFTLDGAADSPLSHGPHNATSGMPITLPRGPQIITPGPSQLSDKPAHVDITTGESLPTPLHTQETLRQDYDLLEVAQTVDSAPAISARESSPVVEVTSERTVYVEIPQMEQHPAVEETHVHETTEARVAQDELLQPQRHDDSDSVGTIDSVHLLSVDRHYPGLRSKLSYFAPLATLVDHFGSLTDTLSIVSEVRPIIRATSGKKDYLLTLQLTDPSMAGTSLIAEIFRPYKGALPSPEEGDAILLRNFMVRAYNHSMVLVSVETSSWAVFSSSRNDAQVDGPPVEYGAEEQTYATDLRQWYQETGMAMVADNQLQTSIERASREQTPASSAVFSDSGSPDSLLRDTRAESSVSTRGSRRGRKSRRRITIHELRDGTRYTEVGSPSGKNGIHELRDGTVYANI